MKPGPSLNREEDFHTRLLDEHWSARQTKEEIQQQIEEIMRGRNKK